MAKNKGLSKAKDAKKDEFYTRYEDIQAELNHYEEHFRGKTVLCNCDDPFESNFCKFFLRNFNYLGLRRLICTSYSSSSVVGQQLSIFDEDNEKVVPGNGYVMDITEVPMANGRGISDEDIYRLLSSKKRGVKKLKGTGDFRSEECIAYLKQADIVVTNPPFSLFREYVAQLIEYEKEFLIIGNQNAITYREIFRLIKDNKMWLGNGFKGNVGFFESPYQDYAVSSQHKEGLIRVSGVMWFTNMDLKKRHETMVLYRRYSPDEYYTYENFDAINVDKTTDLPKDYEGIMGVPITFLDKFNPEQFEIIGLGISNSGIEVGVQPYKPEHKKYRKEIQKRGAVDGDLYIMIDGVVTVPYARVLIRNKHPEKGDE
ncbi:MAG: adenine-specific methyltransferase EcoRI family protein [Clostridia bacterium]|nr:adenine-specific methyltransferase EcoRI family protein [Clostridia bacterium]